MTFLTDAPLRELLRSAADPDDGDVIPDEPNDPVPEPEDA